MSPLRAVRCEHLQRHNQAQQRANTHRAARVHQATAKKRGTKRAPLTEQPKEELSPCDHTLPGLMKDSDAARWTGSCALSGLKCAFCGKGVYGEMAGKNSPAGHCPGCISYNEDDTRMCDKAVCPACLLEAEAKAAGNGRTSRSAAAGKGNFF